MVYIIILSLVGVFLSVLVMAGLDTVITGLRIIIHPGGDQPATVTVTGMVTTMVTTADITGAIIMVIIMESIRAAAQDIVQGTMTDTIRQTARIFTKAGQVV
jgi:hypothetical protein